MDGAQLDDYYSDQLYVLNGALMDLSHLNWDGLFHWLSAKATWTEPPLAPAKLAEIRKKAADLMSAL